MGIKILLKRVTVKRLHEGTSIFERGMGKFPGSQ